MSHKKKSKEKGTIKKPCVKEKRSINERTILAIIVMGLFVAVMFLGTTLQDTSLLVDSHSKLNKVQARQIDFLENQQETECFRICLNVERIVRSDTQINYNVDCLRICGVYHE